MANIDTGNVNGALLEADEVLRGIIGDLGEAFILLCGGIVGREVICVSKVAEMM